MSARIPEAAFEILDGKNFGVLATLMPDGSPQATVVWIERDGDNAVLYNTEAGRAKVSNVERDPRVALTVFDHNNPYRYVQVRGQARPVDADGAAHIDKLSNKYLGMDYPAHREGFPRIVMRIEADAVAGNI